MLTHREALYVAERIKGTSKRQALLKAGFNLFIASHPERIETPKILEAIEKYQAEIVENTIKVACVDATEMLENLTDEIRGDISELYDEQNELLPIKKWPAWARKGGVEVLDEPNMVPSKDGGEGSWDQVGRKIKVKMPQRHKAKELAMKHKDVKAMHEPANNVTVNITTIEARLLAARKRVKSNDVSLIESSNANMRVVNEIEAKDETHT